MSASSRSSSARRRTAPVDVAEFRIISTINEARLEVKEGQVRRSGSQMREKNDIERLPRSSSPRGPPCGSTRRASILWEHFLAPFPIQHGEHRASTSTRRPSCRFMNRRLPAAGAQGATSSTSTRNTSRWSPTPLRWVCEDDPYNPSCFALQLVTKPPARTSPTRCASCPVGKELYQSDETVFPGPPRWLEETEVMPRYLIPKTRHRLVLRGSNSSARSGRSSPSR